MIAATSVMQLHRQALPCTSLTAANGGVQRTGIDLDRSEPGPGVAASRTQASGAYDALGPLQR